ncbi:hypothetical protein [Nocardia coubleae]|uniref:Uncharacterized protein n=1 Tax=Nocardia coubleae TaxID=356147 RepID=A0A846WEB1_9NOCA|nr:hypothetical protein [Nocardia coubleae]NKX90930.1 hypothetical protein [Nocardia coubleae]
MKFDRPWLEEADGSGGMKGLLRRAQRVRVELMRTQAVGKAGRGLAGVS